MGAGPGDPSWGGKGTTRIDFDDDTVVDLRIEFDSNTALWAIPLLGSDGHMNEITAEHRVLRPRCWPLDAGTELGHNLPGNIIWHAEDEPLIEWMWGSSGVQGIGTWAYATNRYMGVRFDTGVGTTNYGWVRMTVFGEFDGAIVHDWAYNTIPGESIFAGDTGVHYVSPTGSNVLPYSSWETAATNIQVAVDATDDGHMVIITNGTYNLTNEVLVTNGISIHASAGACPTVINAASPQHTNRCFRLTHPEATLSNLTITGGRAIAPDGYGGGILSECGGSVIDCVLTGNVAATGGGLAFMNGGLLRNCVVGGNEAATAGGVYMSGTGSIVHATIASNQADATGGLLLHNGGAVTNSIVYGNQAVSNGVNWHAEGTGSAFAHTCTEPLPDGESNLAANPLFVNAPAGDFRLAVASPCIDAATHLPRVTSDIEGVPRPLDGNTDGTAVADIGAHEHVSATADTDRDGLTDAGEVHTTGTSPVAADSDADQMPDGWEVGNGLDPLVADADQDPDFDTMSNGDEYFADTDPHSPLSVLSVIQITAELGGVRVDWKGGREAWQFLEYRSDLAPSNSWTPILAIPPPTPPTNAVIDLRAVGCTRFYRIRTTR